MDDIRPQDMNSRLADCWDFTTQDQNSVSEPSRMWLNVIIAAWLRLRLRIEYIAQL